MNNKKKYIVNIFAIILVLLFMLPFTGFKTQITSLESLTPVTSSGVNESWDFSSDPNGATGTDISYIDEYHGYVNSYCDQRVLDGPYDHHEKVLVVRDAQGGLNTWSVHHLSGAMEYGMIEYSIRMTPGGSSTNPNYHYLKFRTTGDTIAFEFRFNIKNGITEFSDGSGWHSALDLEINLWYRFSLTFDRTQMFYEFTCTDEVTPSNNWEYTNLGYKNNVAIEEVFIGTDVSDYHGNTQWDDLLFTTNEIVILSPESREYNSPMSGYYPSVYGFENNTIGQEPDDWDLTTTDGSSYYKIIDELDGHKNIFEVRKTGGSVHCNALKNFAGTATQGTIEFWIYKNSDSYSDFSKVYIQGNGGSIGIFIMNKDIYYGSSFYNKFLLENDVIAKDTWYYVRIDFNIAVGWQFQIGEHSYGTQATGYQLPFNSNPTEMTGLSIGSLWSGGNPDYSIWLDALGYSWHQNYNVNDNTEQGILLDYEARGEFTSISYSLDSTAPEDRIPLYGDIVIQYPETGEHVITVYGDGYESEPITFMISPLQIKTPNVDQIFRKYQGRFNAPLGFDDDNQGDYPDQSKEGIYEATLGFDDDIPGQIPDYSKKGIYYGTYSFDTQWDKNLGYPAFFERIEYGMCYVGIENQVGGHKDVARLGDAELGGLASMYQDFTSPIPWGTVDLWFRTTNAGLTNSISISNGGVSISLRIADHRLKYYNGNSLITSSFNVADNTWYHIEVRFTCEYNSYDTFIKKEGDFDHTQITYAAEFKGGSTDGFTQITMSTGSGILDFWYDMYIDAIGYSWDDNYKDGDNLEDIRDWHSGGDVSILENLDGHNYVAELYDSGGDSYITDRINQKSGEIEFWIRVSGYGEGMIRIADGDAQHCLEFGYHRFGPQQVLVFNYRTAQGWYDHPTKIYYPNNWYHVRIQFDCEESNKWDAWVDDFHFSYDGLPFIGTPNKMDTITFTTEVPNDADGGYNLYVDAIGYSWDQNYYIGDNRESVQWISFMTTVEDEIDNHLKVAKLNDNSNNDYARMWDTFGETISGTIEYWVRTTDSQKCAVMGIEEVDFQNSIDFQIKDGFFIYYADTLQHTIKECASNQWYHIRIDFDCTDDWHLWIDGVSQDGGTGYEFQGNPQSMDTTIFLTDYFDQNYALYVDAIAYSWHNGYNIGENLGGIYLDFTGYEGCSWVGYSIDDGPLEIISGPCFIPKPAVGQHNIRIFGECLTGEPCSSEVVNFEIVESIKLLCVHGFTADASTWNKLASRSDYQNYYDDIIAISYYGGGTFFSGVDFNTPIEDIANRLYNYVSYNFEPNTVIDIVCHSMGGLVTRSMIKQKYADLRGIYNIRIRNVATFGSPHYGILFAWFGSFLFTQVAQMGFYSPFVLDLAGDDDTPYSRTDPGDYNDIMYITARCTIGPGIWSDGVVDLVSATLYGNDVIQVGNLKYMDMYFYLGTHNSMVTGELFNNDHILKDVFDELTQN